MSDKESARDERVEHSAELALTHAAASHTRNLNRYSVLTNLWASVAGIAYGYSVNIIGASLAQPTMASYFDFAGANNLAGLIGTTAAAFHIGGALGAPALSYVADRWGRKVSLATAAALSILGQTLTGASAASWGMLIFARIVTGAAGWGMAMSAMTYQSELSVAESRGFLAGSIGFTIALGYAIAAWVSVGIFYLDNAQSWRVPVLIGLIWPVILLVGVAWAPETPRWLYTAGREEEAYQVLEKMHRSPIDLDNLYAKEEARVVKLQTERARTLDGSWLAIFTKPGYRKRVALVFLACNAQLCSGIQGVVNFNPTLYGGLGFSNAQQLLFSAGWITIAPVESLVLMYICDRVGRKKLLAASPLGVAGILVIYSVLVKYFAEGDNRAGKAAAVAMLYLYIVVYLLIEVALFTFIGEIFPSHNRAKGVAIGCSANALSSIWTTLATPTGLKTMGWAFLLIFAGLSVFMGVCVILFVPETARISLERIAQLFGEEDEMAKENIDEKLQHHEKS